MVLTSIYDGNQNHDFCTTLDHLNAKKCISLILPGLLISNLILLGQFKDLLVFAMFTFQTEKMFYYAKLVTYIIYFELL